MLMSILIKESITVFQLVEPRCGQEQKARRGSEFSMT